MKRGRPATRIIGISKREEFSKLIDENPNISMEELAQKLDTSIGYISLLKSNLKRSKIPQDIVLNREEDR